jgi:bifunctional NMN adenylyltransferase/nudix hydrolase
MSIKKKIGCCICRLQTPALTQGHELLLDYVQDISDQLIVILGIAPTMIAINNPLTYDMRKDMVENAFPHAIVLGVKDISDDLLWSNELDKVLLPYDSENITIYGGRDSFIPYYVGKYETVDIGKTQYDYISATQIRNSLKDYKNFHSVAEDMLSDFLLRGVDKDVLNFAFRCGVIWASQNKFPVAFATVDIATVRVNKGVAEILLGRKPKQDKFVIVGGFVDPTDENYKFAANRELSEEIKGIKTTELQFIDSFKIDDWRYRKTTDKIITNLFITSYISGEPEGADDLAEAKFFTFEQAVDVIGSHHKHLLKAVENNLELVGIKNNSL